MSSNKSPLRKWSWKIAGTIIITTVLLFVLLVWRVQVANFSVNDLIAGTVPLSIIINVGTILVFIMAMFFPISAFAYQEFQKETQIKELEEDFRLLGLTPAQNIDNPLPETPQINLTPVQKFGAPLPETFQRGRSKKSETHPEPRMLYQQVYNPKNFFLQSGLAAIFAVIGLSLVVWPPKNVPVHFSGPTLQAMGYGFLGAYLFSVYLIYRRYTTLDLQPAVYMHCILTMLAGLIFNYIAFRAISNLPDSGVVQEVKGLEGGIMAIVAFALGYFPSLAIVWFNRLAHSALGVRQRRAEALPLKLIDGISDLHETRLREEGIDNLQNLAAVKIDKLLLRTRFTAQQAVEWVDQAVLYLYLDPSEIESFRRTGVRCISDFQAYWGACYTPDLKEEVKEPSQKLQSIRKSRAQQLQSTPERLDVLYQTTQEGPNMAYIQNYWKHAKEWAQDIQATAMGNLQAKGKFREAYLAVVDEKYEKAILAYREAIMRAPKLIEPYFHLGILYRRQGAYSEAVSIYQEIIDLQREFDLDPNVVSDAYAMLGYMYIKQDRIETAITACEKAIGCDCDNARAYYMLGWAYSKKWEQNKEEKEYLVKASNAYNQAKELNPKDASAHSGLGEVYSYQDSTEDAIAAYQLAIGLEPRDPHAYKKLGAVYANSSRIKEAVDYYQRAAEVDPKHATNYYVAVGDVYYKHSSIEKAIDAYKKAISLESINVDAHNRLGEMYATQGELDKAIIEYERVIGVEADNCQTYRGLGDVYNYQGAIKEAVDAYEHALVFCPDNADAHNKLGEMYAAQGFHDKARAEYLEAAKINGKRALFHLKLAYLYAGLDQKDEATTEIEEAKPIINSEDHEEQILLAACYLKLGQTNERNEQIKNCRQLKRQPFENEYKQARFEALYGNVERALKLLRIAFEKKQRSRDYARRDPGFDFICDDSRFKVLIGEKLQRNSNGRVTQSDLPPEPSSSLEPLTQ